MSCDTLKISEYSSSLAVNIPVATLNLPDDCLPKKITITGASIFEIRGNQVYLVKLPPIGTYNITVTVADLHERFGSKTATYQLKVVKCVGCRPLNKEVSNDSGS